MVANHGKLMSMGMCMHAYGKYGHIGAQVYGVEFVRDINTYAKGAICQDGKGSS